MSTCDCDQCDACYELSACGVKRALAKAKALDEFLEKVIDKMDIARDVFRDTIIFGWSREQWEAEITRRVVAAMQSEKQ